MAFPEFKVTQEMLEFIKNSIQNYTPPQGLFSILDEIILIMNKSPSIKIIGSLLVYFIYLISCLLVNRAINNKLLRIAYKVLFCFSLISVVVWTLIIITESFWIFSIYIVTIIFYFLCWEMSKNKLIIQPFSIPKEFIDKYPGNNGEVLANLISTKIKHIICTINHGEHNDQIEEGKSLIKKGLADKAFSLNMKDILSSPNTYPEISVKEIKISIGNIIDSLKKEGMLKKLFKYNYFNFCGCIVKNYQKWELIITGGDIKSIVTIHETLNIFSVFNDDSLLKAVYKILINVLRKKPNDGQNDKEKSSDEEIYYSCLASDYIDKKEFQKAKELLSIGLKKYPESVGILYGCAKYYYYISDWQKVMEFCEKIITIRNDDYRDYGRLGMAYSELGKYNEAIQQYNIALSMKNDDWLVDYNIGLVYLKTENIEEAIKSFENAKKKNNNEWKIYYYLGDLYKQNNNNVKAIENFEYVKNNKKNVIDVYQCLGKIYKEQREKQKAIENYELYIFYEKENKKELGLAKKALDELYKE